MLMSHVDEVVKKLLEFTDILERITSIPISDDLAHQVRHTLTMIKDGNVCV